VDYVLLVHLPSQTRRLAAAVDGHCVRPSRGRSAPTSSTRRATSSSSWTPPSRGRRRKRPRESDACATKCSSRRDLPRSRPRVRSSTGRTRASAIATARFRRGPSTSSGASAPRASSDAPVTSPLQTSGEWPRCCRPTAFLQTSSARGRPCDRHHSRTVSSELRRSRASESRSPASGLSSASYSSLMPLRPTSSSTPSAETPSTCGGGGWWDDSKPQLVHERHIGVVPPGPDPTPRGARAAPRGLSRACFPRTPRRSATSTSPRRTSGCCTRLFPTLP